MARWQCRVSGWCRPECHCSWVIVGCTGAVGDKDGSVASQVGAIESTTGFGLLQLAAQPGRDADETRAVGGS